MERSRRRRLGRRRLGATHIAAIECLIYDLRHLTLDASAVASAGQRVDCTEPEPQGGVDGLEIRSSSFAYTPKKMLVYLDQMNRAGLVTSNAADWENRFFPAIQNRSRS